MTDGRALVLGGGGLTGVGWLVGMLAGLADEDIDLCAADLVVGTSSGAVVGAQITAGASPEELYAHLMSPAVLEPARLLTAQAMAELGGMNTESRNPDLTRARIGRAALAMDPIASEAELRRSVEARCPVDQWPARRLLLSAVDAETGEFVAFGEESGISLVDAVVASCALPFVYPPATAMGRRWIDGFIRSPANADLATGYPRVVVLAPMAEGFGPVGQVPEQVAQLRDRTGAATAMVIADETVNAVNPNPLDPAGLAPVAVAGRAQAKAAAATVADVWS